MEHHPLFWIGLALILTSVILLLLALGDVWDCCGVAGILCLPFLSITSMFSMSYIIGGILCMVSTAQWCLGLSCIINTLSGFLHIYMVCNFTDLTGHSYSKTLIPEEGKTTKNNVLYLLRVIPEMIGIALSFAAFGVAIFEICDNDSFLC